MGTATRPEQSRAEAIVARAWDLARRDGIGGFSLRALAGEVGIRQPSLYAHFDSKHALYDAMFADGNRQLLAQLNDVALPDDPRAAVKRILQVFVDFALEDSARCYLLFQRPIPGFDPSGESYAIAQAAMARVLEVLRTAGVDDQADVDCIVAMVAGLIDAQISNDPDGDRWTRHLERLTDLYLDEATGKRQHP